MPRVKDLGITSLAFARPEREGARGRGYLMCSQTCIPSKQSQPIGEPCFPTPPQCHPTTECAQTCPAETCELTPGPEKKNARGIPHHAVAQIKQQMHQLSRQLHH